MYVQVIFDAQEALGELRRFGLLKEKCVVPTTTSSSSTNSSSGGSSSQRLSAGSPQPLKQQQQGVMAAEPKSSEVVVLYSVVGCRAAQRLLEQHWADLLQRRVGSILQGLPSE